MKFFVIPGLAAAALLAAANLAPAEAAGCLKGAAVGAVAGHYAGHHAILGAAGGCVVGRHMANRDDARNRAYEPGAGYNPPVEGYQRPQAYGQP